MATVSESQIPDPPTNSSSTNPNLLKEEDAKIKQLPKEVVEQLILDLQDHETRTLALSVLVKEKANIRGLADILWYSFRTVAVLLEEVTGTYKALSSLEKTAQISERVCNALALFQVLACHETTAKLLVKANIPIYLYPLLEVKNIEAPYEHLRLTSLGVIGALVKFDNEPEYVTYFLESQIVPRCLRCMEIGCTESGETAVFIVQKLLSNPKGQNYFCDHLDRSLILCFVLKNMLDEYGNKDLSLRLLKYAVDCYIRLSDCPRVAQMIWNFRARLIPKKFADRNLLNSYMNSLDHSKQQVAIMVMVLPKKLKTECQMQNFLCGHH